MNKRFDSIVLSVKKPGIVLLACSVFAAAAYAQTDAPALPPLGTLATPATENTASAAPGLPPIPMEQAGNTLPELPINTQATPPATTDKKTADLPPASVKTAESKSAETKTTAENVPAPLADLPLPMVDAATQPAAQTASSGTPTPPELPKLPSATDSAGAQPASSATPTTSAADLPAITALAPPSMDLPVPTSIADNGGTPVAPTSLPEVNNTTPAKPKEKTWKTTLAPTVQPMRTHFNYKRDMLPGAIYSPNYAEWNKHLPVQLTRQDYANLLFASVVNNDVVATRALLNAGTDVNTKDVNGETPLTIARRAGAPATTELLIARGGH